jgi:hypothetical protein
MDSRQVERQLERGWERAEDIAARELAEARVQLHHALQLLADVGRKLSDDADTEYLPTARGLATGLARGTRPFRAALGIGDFTLHLTDAEGKPTRRLPLAGKTYAAAVTWLRAELDALGADGAKVTGKTPYDLPPHKILDGAPFAPPGEDVLRKLTVHFSNAWRVLSFVSESTPDCSAPRCSAAAFAYESRTSPAEGIDIAIGFRPGDAERNEPYFYVALAPRPHFRADEIDDLAELEGGGEWNDEDWFGAVLPGSAYTIYDTESAQAASVLAFFDSALEQLRTLAGLEDE